MRRIIILIALLASLLCREVLFAQTEATARLQGSEAPGDSGCSPWPVRIADSYILRHPDAATSDSGLPGDRWTYEQGLMLEALRRMWLFTGGQKYLDFVRNNVDRFVGEDGKIRTYKRDDFNLDNIAGGRALLFLYQQTKLDKYRIAAASLRGQLRDQPRTQEGGFWHKKIYPQQMWLDGLYMAEPFYAWYSVMFDEPSSFDDIALQFITVYRHTLDSTTGLCRHGWDASGKQRWAESSTGRSPCVWGRALGWYLMGLVDVLEYFPRDHARRSELLRILQSLAEAVVKFRDKETGVWFQVLDQGGREGNYRESSSSAMFTYAFARGAAGGYLDRKYYDIAVDAFKGITSQFVSIDQVGAVNLSGTCRGAGLGGTPYRDGSFGYYVGVPVAVNDMKGVGPFLLAAIEIERGKHAGGRMTGEDHSPGKEH